MDTDSLYELQQSINKTLSDIAKDHTGVSPGKMHGMRIRLQDAKGIFLTLCSKSPKETRLTNSKMMLLGIKVKKTLKSCG